jgi:hypothetical protein
VDRILYGEPRPYWASLSNVSVFMAIMHIFMVKLLCQAVMGWILVLECLLPGACGCARLRPVLSGIKWPCCPRIPALEPLAQVCAELGLEEVLDQVNRW